MRRILFLLVLLVGLVATVSFVWPTRWRYEHISVDGDSYLVRIDRMSGHVDILVPESGWTPSEQPRDVEPPSPDQHT
jgi:hypothetical protein